MPAAAIRAMFSVSKRSSMPINTAPGFICISSLGVGARTFNTSSAPSAALAAPTVAPAAIYAASMTLLGIPAPDSTTTSCFAATSFLMVSGLAATRDSSLRTSFGTPIFIVFLLRRFCWMVATKHARSRSVLFEIV